MTVPGLANVGYGNIQHASARAIQPSDDLTLAGILRPQNLGQPLPEPFRQRVPSSP